MLITPRPLGGSQGISGRTLSQSADCD